ncbi:hypothetical protein ASE66_16860 [Bosea sp. Root483D1]|uniref:DUF1127 domain-containing protein n=1 Tax=Bosea sp. Root483D1 TaxID=1736544 RepID=UPI00070DB4C8|nr:DUF1127 domain-containing protein [Bosea sp. Root483D1]KRE12236.1 hypothetical protein ASE66_16860 [Bosea sp. Root483D1]
MYALRADFFHDIDDLTDTLRPRTKSVLDQLVGRMAVGQILGDQFLYEVHGPFVPPHRKPARRPLTARLIEALSGRLRRIALGVQIRHAANALSVLDDRMLKDIGISRSEIEFSVRRVDLRP